MGELQVGDLVFDDTGAPCKVTWVSPIWQGRDVYHVLTDDGDEIVADAEHEWPVRLDRKHGAFTRRTTKYLAQLTSPRNPMIAAQGALQRIPPPSTVLRDAAWG